MFEAIWVARADGALAPFMSSMWGITYMLSRGKLLSTCMPIETL